VTAASNSSSVCTSTHRSASFFHHFSASPWCAGADAETRDPAACAATPLVRGVSHGVSMGGRAGSMLGPGPRSPHSSGPQGRTGRGRALRGGFSAHAGVRSISG
jgi:hypothetical protein